MSAIPAIMYKKLCREHLILQRTFATVCQSLNEALDKSQRPKEHISNTQQKKFSKKEFDELKRQVKTDLEFCIRYAVRVVLNRFFISIFH
jgi:hypothetical protein